MKFSEIFLKGAFLIEIQKKEDERGFFARTFCKDEYNRIGLTNEIVQINNSFNKKKGTLRGMHYQLPPMQEDKIIRCIRGAIYDVIIDIRQNSVTFGKWFGIELNDKNRKSLFVPKGFAHGFITLKDNSEILYLVTSEYSSGSERGIRWDDPKFDIKWPINPSIVSKKDNSHPFFDPNYHLK